MPVVPAPPDFSTGIAMVSQLQQLADAVAFLQAVPIAELRQTSAQTLSNGVWTGLTYTTEDVDSEAGHDTSSNTSRYTAVYPGWYECSGGYVTAASATGLRGTRWAVNGTAVNGSSTLEVPVASATAYSARTKQVYLNIGDYVELQAFQSSGGNLNTVVSAESQSGMSVRWVRS